jgi:acetate kinase
MDEAILVVNAGSSSIKFAVWPADEIDGTALMKGEIARIAQLPHFTARNAAGEILADHDWQSAKGDQAVLLGGLADWIAAHFWPPARGGRPSCRARRHEVQRAGRGRRFGDARP